MRVLFVASGLGLGGAERQIVLLSRELERLGHCVSIYTLTRDTPRMDELAGTRVKVTVDSKRLRLDPAVLLRLRRHIRAWRPDVVHGFLYDGDIYSRIAACGTRLPVLNSERNDNYELSRAQLVGYRLTALLCDGIVANSHAGARFAQRVHPLLQQEIHVVWNGIDLAEVDARLKRAPKPAVQIFPEADVKRLCMVGAIKPQKDYLLALRVMRQLVDQDASWRLVCVGDALSNGSQGYKARVLAECGRLQLEPFVKFVGTRRDVLEIMAASDLVLVTSLHEGFPNVLLEAMASGTAVVSTDYSDVRLILPADQVVGSRREGDLADAVVRCYARRAEVASAQRRWVERHASASTSAPAMVEAYARYVAPFVVALQEPR